MPVAAFTLPVAAPQELVWRILADSAATPQLIDQAVDAVRVVDLDPQLGLLREVSRSGRTSRERVQLDAAEGSLTATLEGDKHYRGSLTLRAELPNPSSQAHAIPRVSARLDWQPIAGEESAAEAQRLSEQLEAQLLSLKSLAEQRALTTHAG